MLRIDAMPVPESHGSQDTHEAEAEREQMKTEQKFELLRQYSLAAHRFVKGLQEDKETPHDQFMQKIADFGANHPSEATSIGEPVVLAIDVTLTRSVTVKMYQTGRIEISGTDIDLH